MGEARKRGTYEERKAEAIKEGRIKQRYSKSKLKVSIKEALMQEFFSSLFFKAKKNR